MKSEREFALSKENLAFMNVLTRRIGINIDDYCDTVIYNRLIRRLRTLKLPNFDSYCARLRTDIEEEEQFINLITNQTTSFFREEHHFDYICKHLLPDLFASQSKVRIWCAGCSTGEEAYTIAIALHEAIPNLHEYDVKILATDVNSEALYTAQTGCYETSRIHKLSPTRQRRWFHLLEGAQSPLVMVDRELKKNISFKHLNLNGLWPMRGSFDIVFYRNVSIYFRKDISDKILVKITKILNPGGVLVLGYSEGLHEMQGQFTTLHNTIFKKMY